MRLIKRNKSSTFVILLVGLVLAILPASRIEAYSCMNAFEPKEALHHYDAVFAGKVLSVREEPTSAGKAKQMMKVQVLSKWKGIKTSETDLVYDAFSTFKVGEQYLFYAYQTTEDKYLYEYTQGELATETLCSRTIKLTEASYDLQELGPSYEPTATIPFWKTNPWLTAVLLASAVLLLVVVMFYFRRQHARKR